MIGRFAVVLAVVAISCAPLDEDSPEDPTQLEDVTEPETVSQALVSCGRLTLAHGLVEPVAGATECRVNAECNASPKPPCAAPSDNFCACTERTAAGSCSAGRCVWHADPGNTQCVCVTGQVEECVLADGAAGLRRCNATGTAWSPCG